MKKVFNKYVPFKGYIAMYFFGFLFVRKEYKHMLTREIENHEYIHHKQACVLLFLFFYLWYGLEYIFKLMYYHFDTHKAYRNISFEREAYLYMNDMSYINRMKPFSFIKYTFKR